MINVYFFINHLKSCDFSLNSDAFYEKLAADAGLDEISDVSEADPNEMAKSLEV